jgi:hypothetical protein
MSTPFKPIQIPPGVVSQATKKMRSSNWSEVNFIRWREGQLMPMGGQSQFTNVVGGVEQYIFASRCKMIHGWYGLDGQYHIAYLCEQHLYVDTGGTLTNVTPTDGIAAPGGLVGGFGDGVYSQNLLLTAAASWTAGATSVTVLGDASKIVVGQHVYNTTKHPYSAPPAQAFGIVQSVVGNVVTLSVAAPDVAEAGNAGDVLDFDWYGKPRTVPGLVAITKVPDAYSLDNFGSILYAMTSADSRLLMWDPAVGGPAVVQPPSSGRGPVPHGRCFVVTQERFLMIFGATQDGTTGGGSARRFSWCDQENPGAWDYANVTSQAGFLDVEPASPIICAIASRVGVLFWTGKKVYASRFLGLPYVYNYVELADGTTPWSPQSTSTTSSLVLWMSEQGVFSYDGTSILPVLSMIRAWIDDDIDQIAVRELSFSAHLGEFNEWWWFYPTLNSPFNTRAAIYNYKEGWWTQCRLSRSAGITSSYTAHPIFADDFVAFQHEVGTVYQNMVGNAPVTLPFAESFDLNLASGAQLSTVKQLLPDVEAIEQEDPQAIANAIGQLRYSLFYRNSRSLGLQELQTPLRPVRQDGYVDFRTTGRDLRLRIDVANQSVEPFTLGQHLIDSVARGDR